MKKTFDIEIDCPNCAVKCQDAINKIDGVNECQINFITQKMVIDCENLDSLMKTIIKTAKRIEPDFEIIE